MSTAKSNKGSGAVNTPMRMCVACRMMCDKKSLLRVVRSGDAENGVAIDLTGKAAGRGAYLCKTKECIERALTTRAIERALNVKPSDSAVAELRGIYEHR